MHKNVLQTLLAGSILFGAASQALASNYQSSEISAQMRDMSNAELLVQNSDDTLVHQELPFTFTFYDRTYTSLNLSSNGFITFNGSSKGCCGGATMDAGYALLGTAIAPAWTDWVIAQAHYKVAGTAGTREAIFSWYGSEYGANGRADFQLVLHEGTNQIEIQYKELSVFNHQVTGGIRDSEGGLAQSLFSRYENAQEPYRMNDRGFMLTDLNPRRNPLPGNATPNPVPEPETWAMLAAGIGMLGLLARRKRQQS